MLVVHHLNDSRSQRVLWLLGSELSGADIQMSFVDEVAGARSHRERCPRLDAWVRRFRQRPAYRRALSYAYAG